MTLVVGFKTRTAIYLSADSAITIEAGDIYKPNPFHSSTSFFEKQINESDKTIHEGILKVFPINKQISCGISGYVDCALDVLLDFQKSMEKDDSLGIDDITDHLQRSINFSIDKSLQTTYSLILGIFANGKTYLVSYNHLNNGVIKEHENFVSIGSGTFNDNQSKNFIQLFGVLSSNLDEVSLGHAISCKFQLNGLHFNQMESLGIGGAFVTITLNKMGIHWPEPTRHNIYSSDSDMRHVDIYSHENLIFVIRKAEKDLNLEHGAVLCRILVNQLYYTAATRVMHSSAMSFKKIIDNKVSIKYFSFLSFRNPIGLLVRRENPNISTDYIRIPTKNHSYGYNIGKLNFLFKESKEYSFYYLNDNRSDQIIEFSSSR